jgi:hypothetical protein
VRRWMRCGASGAAGRIPRRGCRRPGRAPTGCCARSSTAADGRRPPDPQPAADARGARQCRPLTAPTTARRCSTAPAAGRGGGALYTALAGEEEQRLPVDGDALQAHLGSSALPIRQRRGSGWRRGARAAPARFARPPPRTRSRRCCRAGRGLRSRARSDAGDEPVRGRRSKAARAASISTASSRRGRR